MRTRVDPVYRNRESGPSHAPDEGTESDLYETDILAWSKEQAVRLRRVAAADRLNNASPDWPNIIEENPEPALGDSLLMRDGTRLRPPAAPDARH